MTNPSDPPDQPHYQPHYQPYPQGGPPADEPDTGAAPAAPLTVPEPAARVGYGPVQPGAVVTYQPSRSHFSLVVVIAVFAVIVPVVVAVVALTRSGSDALNGLAPGDETTYLPGVEPTTRTGVNVQTVTGMTRLLDTLQDRTGSTEVFSAVLYPRYAVMYVPTEATGGRYQNYYYDGRLESQDSRGTSDDPRFDLADVDPAVMVRLLKRVRTLVDTPTSWYAVIDPPDEDGMALAVYASNAFSESAFIQATLGGKVLRTYDSTRD